MKLTKSQLREIIKEEISKLNESKLEGDAAWNFQKEFLKKFGSKRIQGWEVEQDYHSGAFIWTNPKSPNTVWATPYWEDMLMVPVDVTDAESGKEVLETTVKLPYTGNFKKDEAAYLRAMTSIFKTIK